MFFVREVFSVFRGGGGTKYFKRRFSGGVSLKQTEKQKRQWGVRGHAPPKLFKNLHTGIVISILVLFKQMIRQILFNVFAPNSAFFSK